MDSNQEDEKKSNLCRARRGAVILVSDILNLLSEGQTVKDTGLGHTANGKGKQPMRVITQYHTVLGISLTQLEFKFQSSIH